MWRRAPPEASQRSSSLPADQTLTLTLIPFSSPSLDDLLTGRSLSLLLPLRSYSSSRRWRPAGKRGVEYPTTAFSPFDIDGHRSRYYVAADNPSSIPSTSQFALDFPDELSKLVREVSRRTMRQLITDAPFLEDTDPAHLLRKTHYMFGDSVTDPDAVNLEDERWLYNEGTTYLYLPPFPRHRSLADLQGQAVTRQMPWILTEEHTNIPCGYVTGHSLPGSIGRRHITGLQPGVMGLEEPPTGEIPIIARTVRDRLAELGRKLPIENYRCFGWSHSSDKAWWGRMTGYVLQRWGAELKLIGLHEAIRATQYGLPIALAGTNLVARKKSPQISLKQFSCYLFKNLEKTGETICELEPLARSEIDKLIKKCDARSYTIASAQDRFCAGTKFRTFLLQAEKSIHPKTLLAGYIALWFKKCVVPYQTSDALPIEVLFPAVQLAYGKNLSLLPAMITGIHRGLRQLTTTFTQTDEIPSVKIPMPKTEFPYTYLIGWLVLHRPDLMSPPKSADLSTPLLQLYEECKWPTRTFSDIRKSLRMHKG
ncbi:uncharacterized protein A4U43_C10F3330 [Asparagus officinalis]|uniref:Aminotransferase-like plant mobile domain-containing protein n=1 Tax=Asparagus officinalis TaxID=4686 RepID=A0A5P1E0E9_ASPOF|nr:uncharacterized protein A4U43_C10F3330 [Asparagus officinalis]